MKHRAALLSELQEFAPHVFSFKHQCKLSGLSKAQMHQMVVHADTVKLRRGTVGQRDTSKARLASVLSRSKRSMTLSLQIGDLRDKLKAAQVKVTLQAVADEANRSGLHTSTGRNWTRQTIKKALDSVVQSKTE